MGGGGGLPTCKAWQQTMAHADEILQINIFFNIEITLIYIL